MEAERQRQLDGTTETDEQLAKVVEVEKVFAAEEAKVKSMIEALGGEAAYVGMRHWGAVGLSGQVRERQDAR